MASPDGQTDFFFAGPVQLFQLLRRVYTEGLRVQISFHVVLLLSLQDLERAVDFK